MLAGTTRAPDDIVTIVPPDLVECTVEKVAINAVMAGCKPEYLPVVLACLEAACTDEFNAHGLLATTYFSGPVVIVNGPIAARIGMNSGINALGQGNRANATIGRALQLVIRNVGGGKPGGVDRATLGNPGKYSFCFAEDEAGSPFEPLAQSQGAAAGMSAVTLFAGAGVQPVVDQRSRTPESLARTLAVCLRRRAPEADRWFRRAGGDLAGTRTGLPGGTLGSRPAHDRTRRTPRVGGGGARRGRGWHRRGHSRAAGGRDAAEIQARRTPDRTCGWDGGPVLGHHRGVGEWPHRQSASHEGGACVTGGVGQRSQTGNKSASHEGGGRMTTTTVTRVVLDPTGELAPAEIARVARPASLDGKTIGLLDISKARGDVFLDRLASRLEERGMAVRRYAKPTFTKPAPVDLRHEISTTCDVVIEALAD